MQELDIPIFKKAYDLYRQFHETRNKMPKQERYTLFQKSENTLLEVIEGILKASQLSKEEKLPVLKETSSKVSLLRVFVRLMKDIKAIDLKIYTIFESNIDEIGRMLGGWIRASKE